MHRSANILDATPRDAQSAARRGPRAPAPSLRAIFEAPDEAIARLLLARFVADYCSQTAPSAVATLERGFDDTTAFLGGPGVACRESPAAYRKRLRTTNGHEAKSGASEEIRRRERVSRIVPNRESAMRLLGGLVMEHDEAWSIGKRDVDMTASWQWRAAGRHGAQEGGPTLTA